MLKRRTTRCHYRRAARLCSYLEEVYGLDLVRIVDLITTGYGPLEARFAECESLSSIPDERWHKAAKMLPRVPDNMVRVEGDGSMAKTPAYYGRLIAAPDAIVMALKHHAIYVVLGAYPDFVLSGGRETTPDPEQWYDEHATYARVRRDEAGRGWRVDDVHPDLFGQIFVTRFDAAYAAGRYDLSRGVS